MLNRSLSLYAILLCHLGGGELILILFLFPGQQEYQVERQDERHTVEG